MAVQIISLEQLKDGKVNEEFQNAAREVIADIQNENKEPGKRRSITIKIDLDPTEDRKGAKMTTYIKTALAGQRKLGTMLFFEKKGKETIAHDEDPAQQKLIK